MPSAAILLRPDPAFRIEAFEEGLSAAGFSITRKPKDSPTSDDVLVSWNRFHQSDRVARRYEAAGARVVIAENGYFGREWRDGVWYAVAIGHHNGAGRWTAEGPCRWEGLGVDLKPWRTDGQEIVVLAQRGIGHRLVREPSGWSNTVAGALKQRTRRKVRIRRHPGRYPAKVPLADDLKDVWAAVTWGSSAGIEALRLGVPVFYGFPMWIGASAALPLADDLERPFLGNRVPMFERLAFAMWELGEIRSGEAFRCLLR